MESRNALERARVDVSRLNENLELRQVDLAALHEQLFVSDVAVGEGQLGFASVTESLRQRRSHSW